MREEVRRPSLPPVRARERTPRRGRWGGSEHQDRRQGKGDGRSNTVTAPPATHGTVCFQRAGPGPATAATGLRRLFRCFSFLGRGAETRCRCCRGPPSSLCAGETGGRGQRERPRQPTGTPVAQAGNRSLSAQRARRPAAAPEGPAHVERGPGAASEALKGKTRTAWHSAAPDASLCANRETSFVVTARG